MRNSDRHEKYVHSDMNRWSEEIEAKYSSGDFCPV